MTPKARAKSIALAPVYALQLATSAKSFLDHPLIGSRRLNRMGLHRARVRLADRLCRWRRRRLARHVRPDWREAFDRDGFVVIENLLPAEEFTALREALLEREWPAREMQQGDAITRRIAIDPDMLEISARIASPVGAQGSERLVSLCRQLPHDAASLYPDYRQPCGRW